MVKSAVEWVPGEHEPRRISHWGRHDFAWWKRAAKSPRLEHPPTAYITVQRFGPSGERGESSDFGDSQIREAKAAAKLWVEQGGLSATVEGRVRIPFEDDYVVQTFGEFRATEDRGVYVWDVRADGMPYSRRGPFEVDEAHRDARKAAEATARDQVVTSGADPFAQSFEILKAYKARSGEVYFTTELGHVGRRLGEYR